MSKPNIHPKLYPRTIIQPDGTKISIVTVQANTRDFNAPTNLKEHPAWSKTRFGKLNDSEKSARTANTGMDIFGS